MTADFEAGVSSRLEHWAEERVAERLWDRDGSLWAASGASPEALTGWLGWLDLPEQMTARQDEIVSLATGIAADGYHQAGVLGMGGSSLAPDLFCRCAGPTDVRVLDSTHPDTVRAFRDWAAARRTVLCVSSKSGTTTEPLAFHAALAEVLPALDFLAITDPGTPLADLAAGQGFRAIVTGEPTVGGRYSALSVFGLVPAALRGLDLGPLLATARSMAAASRRPPHENPGLALGAFLAEAAATGHDKLTILAPPALAVLGDWVEQLVAESLGKRGMGIVPVVGEEFEAAETFGPDRAVVVLEEAAGSHEATEVDLLARGFPVRRWAVPETDALGGEFVRWQVATATAALALAVNPFDQPNVAEAKAATEAALSGGGPAPTGAANPVAVIDDLARSLAPGDYLAILAFLPPTPEVQQTLGAFRAALRRQTRAAVTVGIGPRYLHSTGQLHKGGPNSGAFLVLTADPTRDLPIPGRAYTFGELIRAQAAGDLATLARHQRRAAHLHFADLAAALGALGAIIDRAG